ncbi:hypothetical protein Tco_0316134 [Tanacetum coccineum]
MVLVLMAKAFTLNDTTPTNNNQRSSSNPSNMQIAQPGMNMDQDRHMLMVEDNVGNQFRPNAVQNVENQVVLNAVQNPSVQNVRNQNRLSVDPGIAKQYGIGNVVTARAEGISNGINGNQIRCYNCQGMGDLARNCTLNYEEFDFMAAAGAYDEIEEVTVNYTLKDNLQQASTSGTQSDSALVYDSYESAELLEPIPEPHQVQQNESSVISVVSNVEQSMGTVEQYPATAEETRAYFESLYNNLAIEVEKVNSVNRKMKETDADLTTELARYKNQEKCFEISQEKYDKLERCYQKSVYQ